MGLLDRLLGKPEPRITDPARLRGELFDAARRGAARRLERMARANEAEVLAQFRSWQQVPEAIRAHPATVQGYVHGLVTIAQLFADRLGRPDLMAALTGPAETNPIAKWQTTLGRARQLLDRLQYDEARPLLADALIDSHTMSGTGVDAFLPVTHGYLAEAYFHGGRAAEAVPHLEHAFAVCERTGDKDGLIAYLGSLFEAHRYLGQTEQAAAYADRLAALAAPQDADRWRTRARIVRAGEPLNRVVAVVDGASFEIDEVRPKPDMHVRFNFERNRVTLRPAVVLTQHGERLAADGRFEEALAQFQQATAADPFDPHSGYHAGFTLLHLARYADAVEAYRSVEDRAPGWFQCRADAWVAEQLVAGALDHGDFVALNRLADGPEPANEKLPVADRLVARRPQLPPARLYRAKALAAVGRADDVRAALEPDVRTRLLVDLAALTQDAAARKSRFAEAAALNGNLVAAASATLALRAADR